MRTISVTDLVTKDTSTIISELVECKYSILDSFGCHRLCQEMYLPGLASRILCKMIIRRAGDRNSPQWGQRVKAGIIKLFSWAAPTMIHGAPPQHSSGGVVIGFNHPSLGEILRLIDFVARYYPDKPYVFPVNLPWYEALCPIMGELNAAGIYLTPMITPSTSKKIQKTNPDVDMDAVKTLSSQFKSAYFELCKQNCDRAVILVAPSATRQRTVFASKEAMLGEEKIEPPTMSMIAAMLGRTKASDCDFIPISVKPPKNFKRGLNLFRRYELKPGSSISLQEASRLARERYGNGFRGHHFDLVFLERIAAGLQKMDADYLIFPS